MSVLQLCGGVYPDRRTDQLTLGQALCGPESTKVPCDCERFILGYINTTLPVFLNVCLSFYCMYSTFQPDRWTGHIWAAVNGRPSPFLLLSLLPASVIPPREGKWWGWSGWPDRASCVTTDLWVCVCGREGGIHRPYYRPNYTLGLTNSYFTASSSRWVAAVTLQDLYCDSMRGDACVLPSITSISSI